MKFHCHECQHDYEVEESRPEIARPAGVEEQLRPHGVVFRWWAHGLPLDARWFGWVLLGILGLACLFFWPQPQGLAAGDPFAWFGLLLLLSLLGPMVRGIFRWLFTRHVVELDALTVQVRAEPLGGGRVAIPVRQLRQLYVTATGELRAQAGAREHQVLLRGRPEILRYVEQQIENRLKIEDQAVAGEWRPLSSLYAEARKCPHCGYEMPEPELIRQAQPLPTPADLEVHREATKLCISWNRRGTILLFLTVWLLIWDSVCLVMLAGGYSAVSRGDMRGFMVLLIPHIWVGVGVTYYWFTLLLNRTELTCDEQTLSIRSGPLPTIGARRELPTETLEQFYVVTMRGSKSVRHQLECRTRSGERLRLLSNEPKARLEFIEQELETFLGIANEST